MSRQCGRILERVGPESPGDRPPPLPTLLPSELSVGLASAWSRQPRTADSAKEGACGGHGGWVINSRASPGPSSPSGAVCGGASRAVKRLLGAWTLEQDEALGAPGRLVRAGAPAQAPPGADLRPPSRPLPVEKGRTPLGEASAHPRTDAEAPGQRPPERAESSAASGGAARGGSVISPEHANCVLAPSALVGLPVLSPLDGNTDWGADGPSSASLKLPFICWNLHIPQRFSGLSQHPGRVGGRLADPASPAP